ncbi:Ig domain-containing protein [Gemmatimonadota bacterium]
MNRRYAISCFSLVAFACLLYATACSDPSQPERVPAVQLAPHAASIAVGDSLILWLLPMLPPGYVPSVDWTSSSPVIASVRKTRAKAATVTGLSPGQAVITVAGDGASDSTVITVITPEG